MKIIIKTKSGIIIIDASNWTIGQITTLANRDDIEIIRYIHL